MTDRRHEKITGLYFSGPGHYTATVSYFGREIGGMVTDMPDVDLYRSGRHGWKSAGARIASRVIGQYRDRLHSRNSINREETTQ